MREIVNMAVCAILLGTVYLGVQLTGADPSFAAIIAVSATALANTFLQWPIE